MCACGRVCARAGCVRVRVWPGLGASHSGLWSFALLSCTLPGSRDVPSREHTQPGRSGGVWGNSRARRYPLASAPGELLFSWGWGNLGPERKDAAPPRTGSQAQK